MIPILEGNGMTNLSHARASFYFAAIAGLLVWGGVLFVAPHMALVLGVDVFFMLYLLRTLTVAPPLDAERLRARARHQDEPLWVVLIITLAAAVLAMVLVISASDSKSHDMVSLILTLASLPLAWTTIHTMMAWHYAHMYWRKVDSEEGDSRPEADDAPEGYHGGLQFPGGKPPGARDFLYFSFIIGVANQTADVSISSSRMRSVSLVHSLVAFVFNTVLLASVVNAVVSLA